MTRSELTVMARVSKFMLTAINASFLNAINHVSEEGFYCFTNEARAFKDLVITSSRVRSTAVDRRVCFPNVIERLHVCLETSEPVILPRVEKELKKLGNTLSEDLTLVRLRQVIPESSLSKRP